MSIQLLKDFSFKAWALQLEAHLKNIFIYLFDRVGSSLPRSGLLSRSTDSLVELSSSALGVSRSVACGILASPPGIEPESPA